ncbi:MAG: hypothetical protein NUV61_03690 [Candidatus Azambacteria bacterium]|nr:hypothetical protein [Candidatus Azambacteria bacterium]
MVTRKTLAILIGVVVLFFLVSSVAVFFIYRKAIPSVPKVGERVIVAQVKYSKGSASFFYPASWQQNDIPASAGFISVQVFDPKDNIVLVASSGTKSDDSKVNGTLVYEKDAVVSGVSGKDRRWEDVKSQVVVFRADNLKFEGKYYRFEMFGALSRKVKMQNEWEAILKSIQFEKGSEEGITATPQE